MRVAEKLAVAALAVSASLGAGAAEKVFRYAFLIAETGFDPPQISDLYSSNLIDNIFDAPLRYDYLERPVRLVPNTLQAMPTISDDGTLYTMKVKPGIYFADDPAFGGKKRELTAADYVYSIKRLYDPRLRSPNLYLFEGYIAGM
ncbi:MAG TPA: ABC transporter substrate-binding protein, partial [Usitatibacter sp.]|nr:ABC transporter substrate-binding protein [Usitatibacter sp.]